MMRAIVRVILVLFVWVGHGCAQQVFAATATFGDGAIEPSQTYLNNNQMALLRVQVPSSGTITKLSVYTAILSGSPVLTGAVYADNNGVVAGLLGTTSAVAVTQSSAAWLDLPGLNVTTSAGYVWIGVMVGPSTTASSAAFWVNFSAPPYQLDSNISVTYPNAPATVAGYSVYANVGWSMMGTLGSATVSPLSVSVTPGSASLQVGSGGLTTSSNLGLSAFEATDIDSHGTVFAGENYGVYKSTDQGHTFKPIFTVPTQPNADTWGGFGGMMGHVWTMYVDSRDAVFVSVISTNRLYRSTDGGATFQEVLNLNRPSTDGNIINMTEDEQGALYAAEYGDSQNGARLFKSTAGGAAGSWVSLRNFAARHLHNVKMNPTNNWLYLAVGEPGNNANGLGEADTKQIFRSKDHGASWTEVVQGTTASGFVALSFYNNWVVLGEDNAAGRSNLDRFQDTGLNQLYTIQTVWTNPSVSMFFGGTNLGNHLLMSTGREGTTGVLNVVDSTDSVNWTSVFSANATTSNDDHRGILTVHPNRGGAAYTNLASGYPASFTLGTAATFTATAAGGVSPYTIRWLDNTGTLLGTGSTYTFTPTTSGTYLIYASVTDATQVSATSNFVTITVNGGNATNHTVTFNANGGTGTMSSQTANAPTALKLDTFTRTGYTFSGWNTAANGTGASYADGATYAFAANVTLYAQWASLSTHTVTFNANGGTGTMAAQTANVPTALTANTFTWTGYTFSGWNTAAAGTGASYADGATYAFAANVTLYAQWASLSTHTVTFNANGGTGTMAAQTANVPTALTANTFTWTTYTFSGWNTAANGTGTSYADGAVYAFAADVTLYAQWTSGTTGVTFGDAAIEPIQSSLNNNEMALLRVQVPSSGTITKLSVYTALLSGSPVLTGAVYADNNGVVAGLLGTTSAVAVTQSSAAWLDLPGLNVPASAGYVWIGVMVGPSTSSSSAAFWVNYSAPAYTLDSHITVAYPTAPATVTSYTVYNNIGWSIKGSF